MGIFCCLTKNIEKNNLKSVLESAADSYYIVTNNAEKKQLSRKSKESNTQISNKLSLTERQIKFINLCASNLCYKEIANQMSITIKTVDRYRDTLFKRFGVKNRVELTLYAIKVGLIFIL